MSRSKIKGPLLFRVLGYIGWVVVSNIFLFSPLFGKDVQFE